MFSDDGKWNTLIAYADTKTVLFGITHHSQLPHPLLGLHEHFFGEDLNRVFRSLSPTSFGSSLSRIGFRWISFQLTSYNMLSLVVAYRRQAEPNHYEFWIMFWICEANKGSEAWWKYDMREVPYRSVEWSEIGEKFSQPSGLTYLLGKKLGLVCIQ